MSQVLLCLNRQSHTSSHMEKLLAHENIRIINTQTIDYLLSMMLFDQNQYSMQQHNLKPGNLTPKCE